MTLGGFDVEGFQCVLGSEIALVVDNSVIAIYDRGGSLQPRSSFGLFDREKIESTQVVLHFFLSLLLKELCVRENARFLPLFSVHTSPRLLTCYHGR